MKVLLQFFESIYNCQVTVKDASGERRYFADLFGVENDGENLLCIEVESGEFELTIEPTMVDYKDAFSQMKISDWKDKLARKIGNTLFSAVDNMFLRVGCSYSLSGVKDGDTVSVYCQQYAFGNYDKLDLLELIPMAYMFFEVYFKDIRCELLNAFGLNGKEVISSSRKIALINFGIGLLTTYPIQVGRIKRLSSNRKIRKTLIRFNKMTEKKRKRYMITD